MRHRRRSTTFFTPYTFVFDLADLRARGRIPDEIGDPHFFMFLLDHGQGAGTPEQLERNRGHHPYAEAYGPGVRISCTRDELDRWRSAQQEVLAALREIEARVRRDLDETAESAPAILRRCKDEMAALAARYERAYTELFDRVDDALAAQQARPPHHRPDTPERRAARERNERYGRGYPTGGFSSH